MSQIAELDPETRTAIEKTRAHLAEAVLVGDAHVVEYQLARVGTAQAEFVLERAQLDAG